MHTYQNVQQLQGTSDYTCPTCSSTRIYHLADSRCKCAICRRLFTPAHQKDSRISLEIREKLAGYFWDMKGASETAEALRLNIKTVQKYFSILREHLVKTNRNQIKKLYGTDSISQNLFESDRAKWNSGPSSIPIAALVSKSGLVNMLKVTKESLTQTESSKELPIGWIYARDVEAMQHSQIDLFHCVPRDTDSLVLTAPFWQFVKQGLIHYQGGFRHHFFQFLNEMEFRYNDRQQNRGLDICMQVLAAG